MDETAKRSRDALRRSVVCIARPDLDRRSTSAGSDHRAEIWAAVVLRPVGVVDEVVGRPIGGLKCDFLRHFGGNNPPSSLAHGGLVPARVQPVIGAHVRASSTATDQIHVGVPYVSPSSRNGEMCKSSASAILRSSSLFHVTIALSILIHGHSSALIARRSSIAR